MITTCCLVEAAKRQRKTTMDITLIASTPSPEEVIANAARTCYDSAPKDLEASRKMIKAIIKSGHESCVEHATATFRLEGVSRVLTHELVRHRLFSFSQRSQRYVKEDEPSFVVPDVLVDDNSANQKLLLARDIFDKAMQNAWDAYALLLSYGLKPEDARFVLPNACTTEIVVSGNFREYRNFLKLRLGPRAQWEIRKAANLILDKLYEIAPSCFEDLKNGTSIQTT